MNSIEACAANRVRVRRSRPFRYFQKTDCAQTNVKRMPTFHRLFCTVAKWFASIGTEKSKGNESIRSRRKNQQYRSFGSPDGNDARGIIFDIGGGIPNNKKFKAAQTGGPSGGCITPEHLDIAIDYDSLMSIGSMMGSGGLIVMDEDN
jgi:NADP-reducing hydrogenase subunit HndC